MSIAYAEHRYLSDDGLSLFYRMYGSAGDRAAVLCLPGLTRNSRDFATLARHLANRRLVICPDLRGRGFSDRDRDHTHYVPATYLRDITKLLGSLRLDRVLVIGTSLGGVLTMLLAAAQPKRIVAAVLNDIGPEVDPRGLERIRRYTGKLPPVSNWDEAVVQARVVYGAALPDLSDADWHAFALCGYREDAHGVPKLDMDPRIGDALREVGGTVGDPWPMWRAMSSIPTLLLRGELSDVLSRDTMRRMKREKPDLLTLDVPNRGHVPLLNEPAVTAAIDRFVDELP
jgi:pimeloyl-ACP methyl ester carboxylesterase